MKRITQASLLLLIAALCASAGSIKMGSSRPASANTINVAFSQPVYYVTPGEVVDVTGVLQNTDITDPVYLNGDNLSMPQSSGLTDFFFDHVPVSLNPSASTGSLDLFSFVVSSNAAQGTYTGSYDLFGGVENANQFNFDLVGSQAFSVVVTPEPSTMLLLGAGMMAVSVLSRRWGRSK